MVVLEGEDFCSESPDANLLTELTFVKDFDRVPDVLGRVLLSSLA